MVQFQKIILGFFLFDDDDEIISKKLKRQRPWSTERSKGGAGLCRTEECRVSSYYGLLWFLLIQHIETGFPIPVSIYCCISGMCLFQSRRSLSLYIAHPSPSPIPSPIRAQIASPISREPFQFPPLSYDSLLFRGGGYPPSMTNKQWWRALIIYTRYISGGVGGRESRESIALRD